MPELRRETHEALVAVLLDLPVITTEEGRKQLTVGWPKALCDDISLEGPPRTVLDNLVTTAARWQRAVGDTPPLVTLIQNAQELMAGSQTAGRLAGLLPIVQADLARPGAGAPPLLPLPPAAWPQHFADLAQALNSGDYDRVLALAQGLPTDYPGLAPLVQRATARHQALKETADALAAAWADRRWDEVVRLADGEPHLPAQLRFMVDDGHKALAGRPAPSWPARLRFFAPALVVAVIGLILVGAYLGLSTPSLPVATPTPSSGGVPTPTNSGTNPGATPTPGPTVTPTPGGDAGLPVGTIAGLLLITGVVLFVFLILVPLATRGPRRDPWAPLVRALLAVPGLAERANRDALLRGLPATLVAGLPRQADAQTDLAGIVVFLDCWGALDDGTPALVVLLENAQAQAPPAAAAPLRAQIAALRTPEPVSYSARFQLLSEAYARGDGAAVRALATFFPPDYPGLAPLLERAAAGGR